MAQRRFDENEVAEIIRRAAEMGPSVNQSSDGLTVDEIERVGVELGLDPNRIRAAAEEMTRSNERSKMQVSLASVVVERTVNAPVSDQVWEEVVSELQRFTAKPGSTTIRALCREWSKGPDEEFDRISLSALQRGSRTTLRLSSDNRNAYLIASVIIPTLTLVLTLCSAKSMDKHGVAAVWIALVSTLIPLVVLGVTVLAARWWAAYRPRRLEALLDTIAGHF